MENTKWYKVVVKTEDGETGKKVSEERLVNAVSVTDAEAKTHELFKGCTFDFEVVSVVGTKIVEVIS